MDGSAGSLLTRDQIDDLISALYSQPRDKGAVKALAASIGWPVSRLCARGRRIGAYQPRSSSKTFKDAEKTVIEAYADRSVKEICRQLRLAGFTRSFTSVLQQRVKMGLDPREERQARCIFTAQQVARACSVGHHTVARWVQDGRLQAKRAKPDTGAGIKPAHEIRSADLRSFLALNPDAIDLRCVPQALFINTLLGDCA